MGTTNQYRIKTNTFVEGSAASSVGLRAPWFQNNLQIGTTPNEQKTKFFQREVCQKFKKHFGCCCTPNFKLTPRGPGLRVYKSEQTWKVNHYYFKNFGKKRPRATNPEPPNYERLQKSARAVIPKLRANQELESPNTPTNYNNQKRRKT